MSNILNIQNFNSLPTCSAVPSSGSQLINKTYGDLTYGIITAANVWTGGANTFNANPLYPTGATVAYVPTCTNATTGAWTWQAIPGGPAVATVQTSNATPTSLVTIATTTGSIMHFTGNVAAANAAYTDATGGSFDVTVLNNAGTLTIVSTAWVLVDASSTASFNLVVSGTSIVLQVTGIAATTYNWKAEYQTVVN